MSKIVRDSKFWLEYGVPSVEHSVLIESGFSSDDKTHHVYVPLLDRLFVWKPGMVPAMLQAGEAVRAHLTAVTGKTYPQDETYNKQTWRGETRAIVSHA